MDYQKTIIYQLKCNDDNITDIYVGHTTNYLKRRQNHKTNCNNPNSKEYNYKKYITIRENGGWENWKMLEICKYPCNDRREADKKEEEVRMELKASLNLIRCWTNGKCSINNCENIRVNNGLCIKHGAILPKCSVDGCENIRVNNELCVKHGAILPKCSVDGCENNRVNNDVCIKHGAIPYKCSVDGCENNRVNNDVCIKHGAIPYKCSVEDCENNRVRNGTCVKHNPNKVRYTCMCGKEMNNDKDTIKDHNNSKFHINYLGLPKEKTRYTCICGSEINNDKKAIKEHNNTKKHLKYIETLNNNL